MKNLDPKTACTFSPPAHINFARIKSLDSYLKKSIPTRYKGRTGRVFYFNFPTGKERDTFLSELKNMIEFRGNQVALHNMPPPAPIHAPGTVNDATGTVPQW